MRKLALAFFATAALLIGTVAPASAHWRGHHHHWGGPGLALGLVAGALAAAAAPPVYYGPAYYYPPRYYYGPRYRVVRYYRPLYHPWRPRYW